MSLAEIPLSDAEFEAIKQRIYDFAGIALSDAKRTLVVSRLSKVVRAHNLHSFVNYIEFLDAKATGADKQEFVNALTTNLTRFYREDHHFDHLMEHIGKLIQNPQLARMKKLRIWSAGCSTGQEPYTIGMCLMDKYPQLKSWDFKILATDVDTGVLAKAATGAYAKNDLAGLDPKRAALFDQLDDQRVLIPQAVRNLVSFKPLNLMSDWPLRGPFDAIFCRNVAIYFDRPTQARLFERLGEKLADHGYLYIGHSENIPTGTANFVLDGKTIYHKNVAQMQGVA